VTPSRQSRWLAFVMYWTLRPLGAVFARPRFIRLLRWFVESITPRAPRGTIVEPGPKGEWVRGAGVDANESAAILYIHGSGYVVCSPKTHRGLIAKLSQRADLPVYAVRYRLAPEHPFPAAFDDTVEAYRHLLDRGYERIVVAGDSAGGHLAISLVAALTEAELPTPKGLVLFSPLVDPSFETAAATAREARDPMFTAAVAKRMLKLYTADSDPADARLAVISGEPRNMPPVLLHAGQREMMAADARALHAWLRKHDVDVRTTIWPGQMHVFQLMYDVVPEAREAIKEAGAFIRERLGQDQVGVSELVP
jgi:acetyl esterase/lipase